MHGRLMNLKQVEMWKEMKRREIMPHEISYTSIISAYYGSRSATE